MSAAAGGWLQPGDRYCTAGDGTWYLVIRKRGGCYQRQGVAVQSHLKRPVSGWSQQVGACGTRANRGTRCGGRAVRGAPARVGDPYWWGYGGRN